MPTFPPFNHFALTVTDLQRSIDWYERLFESPPAVVFDEEGYRAAIWFEPVFALHEHQQQHAGERFDEFRVGLDHIAFGCSSREELEAWPARLDALGIEHGDIVDRFYGSGLAFRDPDNIQLEFFYLAGG
jgi:catechol 2,3-dioxygenase-like lactoylglutathione lyase family enzyme